MYDDIIKRLEKDYDKLNEELKQYEKEWNLERLELIDKINKLADTINLLITF